MVATSATILWVVLTMLLFSLGNIWMDLVGPLASLVVSVAVGGVFSYQTEGKARRRLRNIFSRYVSAAVVTEILSKDEDPGLGGKEVSGTVFFSDIKDFTAISEKMTPRELVDLLNHYFTLATDVIHQNQGMLDKYLGDSMMALFGVPVKSNTHAVQACLAALQVQAILERDPFLNADGRPKLITRIGLNSGEMVVGNVGSHQRLDFTAMGDTVNLASRLEGVNKLYGTRIVIGEATLKESRDTFLVRPLDNLRVKGKETPVAIYELLCEREKATENQQILAQGFRQGIGYYRGRQFDKALGVFTELLAGSSQDGPSQLYVERCRSFLASPPPSDWTGVTTLQTK
jgi:adenylate cyclase